MKIVGYFLLALFIAFGLGLAFLETGPGHHLAKRLILRSLEQSGVEIGELQGEFPQDIRLKDVRIQGLHVEEAQLEISLPCLLKRELCINQLKAKGVETPAGSLNLQGSLSVKKNGRLKFSLEAPDLKLFVKGQGSKNHWAFEGHWDEIAQFRGSAQGFAKAEAKIEMDLPQGKLFADVHVEGAGAHISWRMPELRVENFEAQELQGTWQGSFSGNSFVGELTASGQALQETWTLKTPLTYQLGGSGSAPQIEFHSPILDLTGHLTLRQDGLWVGALSSESANLQLLRRWRPSLDVYGLAKVDCSVDGQAAACTILAKEFYFRRAYAKELALSWTRFGELSLNVAGGKWGELFVHTANLTREAPGSFHLSLDGTLKEPLHLECAGTWKDEKLVLETASGTVLNHSLSLQTPASFEAGPQHLKIEALNVLLDNAAISLNFDAQPGEGNLRLDIDQLPLDLLSLAPLEIPLDGWVNLKAEFHEKNNQTTGQIQVIAQQIESSGEQPLLAKANFEALLNRNLLRAKGAVALQEQKFLTVETALPMEVNLWPLTISPLLDKKASGHLAFQGRLEELLDFVDFGTHRLTGECISDLTMKNTLGSPRIQGFIRLQNGSYENYLTGTELIHLNAECTAENDRLYLRSLSAQDAREGGTLSATGHIHLSIPQHLPFHFDLAFSELTLVQIDLLSTDVKGNIAIDGNWTEAIAKGAIEIEESDMTIPDRIPRPLPDIKPIYKNAPKPLPPTNQRLVYPLHLDLSVKAPSCLFIEGRGLSSQWKGDFLLGGTFTSPSATGKLELLQGEFLFSGHSFTLTEGALSFVGKEHEMPRINIAGNIAEHGISIDVRLSGPLNHPQIAFHSTPPLPVSSILSYLLFGEDISEITAFQAIQLASSVGTLSGQSPDLLESTRKSLGIDRLRIISTPTGTDAEGETVAIQVGKYIAHGVIVSVSQGAEESSTNINIDVDLGHGFFLQAETDQRQEQGVFGLKWNVNY